jgi:hypothetical protein
MTYVSLILIALLLSSCATTPMTQLPPSAKGSVTDCDLLLPSCPTFTSSQPPIPPPTPQEGPSVGQVLGAIALLPFAILTAGYGYRGGYGYQGYHRTTCRSYVYKDNFHTTCY